MIELETSIVDTVESHFVTHVLNINTFAWLHFFITDLYNKGIYTFVLALDNRLSKYDGVVSVTGTVSDPEFLSQNRGCVNCELLGFVVIGRSCFHFWCIITIS